MADELPSSIFTSRAGGEEEDVLRSFILCPACRQPVDRRDLRAVFHHGEVDHEPMSAVEAVRLLGTEDRERLVLVEHALFGWRRE